jgi:hypothetical protein
MPRCEELPDGFGRCRCAAAAMVAWLRCRIVQATVQVGCLVLVGVVIVARPRVDVFTVCARACRGGCDRCAVKGFGYTCCDGTWYGGPPLCVFAAAHASGPGVGKSMCVCYVLGADDQVLLLQLARRVQQERVLPGTRHLQVACCCVSRGSRCSG